AEYGRMEVEGEQVAQASGPARTIVAIIGAKPDLVSPNIGQQNRDDAKGVEPNLLDWDCLLPAPREGVAPESCPQRRRPIDESEEAQAKAHVQQNAGTTQQHGGEPKGALLNWILPAQGNPQAQYNDRHDEEAQAPRVTVRSGIGGEVGD